MMIKQNNLYSNKKMQRCLKKWVFRFHLKIATNSHSNIYHISQCHTSTRQTSEMLVPNHMDHFGQR